MSSPGKFAGHSREGESVRCYATALMPCSWQNNFNSLA